MISIDSVKDYHHGFSDLIFDFGIFASGYESRSTYILQQLENIQISQTLVLGFEKFDKSPQRILNDKFYMSKKLDVTTITGEDNIYELLSSKAFATKDEFNVLVDYSSMPRNWYNAIISWCKFQNIFEKINLYFTYTIGSYELEYSPFIIENIISVPGLEGSDIFNEQSIALFGIGFDGNAALGVYDELEPDILHIFSAETPESGMIAKELNEDLIQNSTNDIINMPLNSVEMSFRNLGELVSSYINNSHITIVPMGPKSLTLASLLICHRFSQITCMHVQGTRVKAHENIIPTGEIVITKVTLSS